MINVKQILKWLLSALIIYSLVTSFSIGAESEYFTQQKLNNTSYWDISVLEPSLIFISSDEKCQACQSFITELTEKLSTDSGFSRIKVLSIDKKVLDNLSYSDKAASLAKKYHNQVDIQKQNDMIVLMYNEHENLILTVQNIETASFKLLNRNIQLGMSYLIGRDIYLDRQGQVSNFNKATYSVRIKKVNDLYETKFYNKYTGIIRAEGTYRDPFMEIEEGNFFSYYKSGKLYINQAYSSGLKNGNEFYYYENGQVWSQRFYENGKLVKVISLKDNSGKNLDFGTLDKGTGTLKIYDKEGKITRIDEYKKGMKIPTQGINKKDYSGTGIPF